MVVLMMLDHSANDVRSWC